MMRWNWTKTAWPHFTYDVATLDALERRFLLASGEVIGVVRHMSDHEQGLLRIELLSDEAVKTSRIEGEILDRIRMQFSLRRQLGLATDHRPVKPQEDGIAEMMVDLYGTYAAPLAHEALFRWHRMLMAGNRDIRVVGAYRAHAEPMQIVSGRLDAPIVHYEAPPSMHVPKEMDAYIAWFNNSAPNGGKPLPALARLGGKIAGAEHRAA